MSESPSARDAVFRDGGNSIISRDCGSAIASQEQRQPTKWKLKAVNDVPSALLCTACGELLAEPIQSTCGERFCQNCFKALVKGEENPVCPVCSQTIEQKLAWPDAFAAKEVNQVVVYCANADAGCNWTGPVNTLQVHLQQCKSRLEICPNGCSEKIANSQVDKHISEECPYRKVVCEHCNRQITFIRKEEHFDACPQFPVRCPNNCSTEPQEMPREQLNSHLQCCPCRKDRCRIMNCNFEVSFLGCHLCTLCGQNHVLYSD
jgi:hypothetical protein